MLYLIKASNLIMPIPLKTISEDAAIYADSEDLNIFSVAIKLYRQSNTSVFNKRRAVAYTSFGSWNYARCKEMLAVLLNKVDTLVF